LFTVAAIVLGIALSFTDGLLGVAEALGEYLYPTTVMAVKLPVGCVMTEGTPPPDLMRIVENQRKLYNLSFQKVTSCMSARSIARLYLRSSALILGEEERQQWRPLDKGCCSRQHRRHIVVEAADFRDTGSTVVQAALIQSRWDYLRLKASEVRGSWVWRWCRSGVQIFVPAPHGSDGRP
jgi:hypothetical protein